MFGVFQHYFFLYRCLPPSEEIDLINVAFEQKGKIEEARWVNLSPSAKL